MHTAPTAFQGAYCTFSNEMENLYFAKYSIDLTFRFAKYSEPFQGALGERALVTGLEPSPASSKLTFVFLVCG